MQIHKQAQRAKALAVAIVILTVGVYGDRIGSALIGGVFKSVVQAAKYQPAPLAAADTQPANVIYIPAAL
ncbi:hypothetical protein [Quatrionicoccus australiensis]|uniref:hypothetical protein n=1 Tax=Quatrionicoccus australiensis TaxID=138118 RepID=UPI001CF9E6AF|nr:hypothetical protein [Quatrionicoccus australiensis]MCB4359577.1 hypothetical protein [Quatrionicoccus australiensis]